MPNDCQRAKRWLTWTLTILMALPPLAKAQAPPSNPQAAPRAAIIRDLKVIVLAGSQEMNDLENKVMAPLVVEVLDQNDQPIEGADVTFRFPLAGPTAAFAGEKSAQSFRTNADGQAAAVGWMANAQLGTFQVQVTAFRGNEEGSAVISMTNVTRITEAGKKSKKWWSSRWGKVAIAAGVAGIVAGIVLATRGGGSSPTVITATPGSPTIGGTR